MSFTSTFPTNIIKLATKLRKKTVLTLQIIQQ